MTDQADKDRLDALTRRIEQAKRAEADGDDPGVGETLTQANTAWQMVIELVVGIAIGVGMGYGLDSLFGTMPWMLIVFTLLGFAAGVRTMMRTAAGMQNDDAPLRGAADEDEGN